jgi:hypothetical protein
MTVPNSMTMEEVSVPGNWANVFSKVKFKDEVIVVPEDLSWRLHLLVVERASAGSRRAAACDRSDEGGRQAEVLSSSPAISLTMHRSRRPATPSISRRPTSGGP